MKNGLDVCFARLGVHRTKKIYQLDKSVTFTTRCPHLGLSTPRAPLSLSLTTTIKSRPTHLAHRCLCSINFIVYWGLKVVFGVFSENGGVFFETAAPANRAGPPRHVIVTVVRFVMPASGVRLIVNKTQIGHFLSNKIE